MKWDMFRKPYQERIKELSKSIDTQLELWSRTGNPIHRKFAEDEMKHLREIKEYILTKESEMSLYKQD